MDEMKDRHEAKRKAKRTSNYPEVLKILRKIDLGDVDGQELMYLIAAHNPGVIIEAYNARKA